MITGILKPTQGQIFFDGKPWNRNVLSDIGALIENPPIYDNLSAVENLRVRALLLGVGEDRIEEVLNIGTSVPVVGAIITVPVLTLVQLWEIPLLLFLSERFGMITEIIACLFITVAGIVIAPTGKCIYLVSAIPMRVVCPLLHILPNGIRALAGDPLLDKSVILPGIPYSYLCIRMGETFLTKDLTNSVIYLTVLTVLGIVYYMFWASRWEGNKIYE